MRAKDFADQVRAYLLKNLPDFDIKGFDKVTMTSRNPGSCNTGLTITIEPNLNKHPTGTDTGCLIMIKMPERYLNVSEAAEQHALLDTAIPVLLSLESAFAATRIWK